MTVDKGVIVYLQEQPGIGKLLVATQTKPTADGWPTMPGAGEVCL